MAPPAKPLPNPDPSTGVQRVDEPAAESVGARLQRQNKGVERAIRGAREHSPQDPSIDVRTWSSPPDDAIIPDNPAAYVGMDADADYLSKLMSGRKLMVEPSACERGLEFRDLYRAYKHTPHQPASVFLKYLVHRINNVDAYDDPAWAIQLDNEFLAHHKKGSASRKNGHLTGQDLHAWMKQHPGMPEALLAHKAALHAELARGVGLNIRSINGEPHIALARGLNTDIMDHEHALSSWADVPETGFGSVMHHAWVPLKDLWFSYQHGPEECSGDMGHENEYLLAHTAPRYEAKPEDVKKVRGHHHPRYYDTATDDELAAAVEPDSPDELGALGSAIRLLEHKGSGPKTYAEVLKRFGGQMSEGDVAGTKHYTREQALASTSPSSIENPNLTRDDLHSKVLQFSQAGILDTGTAGWALKHPAATADTARLIASQVPPDGTRDYIWEDLAKSPLTPPDVLSRIVDRYEQLPPGSRPLAVTYALNNPNSTSEQADRVVRLDRAKGHYDSDSSGFLGGKYSAATVNELSDRIAKGYGKEPLHAEYIHGISDPNYRAALEKFNRAKAMFSADYNALVKLGMNRHLDDDAIEALCDAAERHGISEIVHGLALRQNAAPMSELSQLRVLRALDAMLRTQNPGSLSARRSFALSKGLAPTTVWALALHPSEEAREALYSNKTVDPEVLAKAWPNSERTPEQYSDYIYREKPRGTLSQSMGGDPLYHLASAIVSRRQYAQRRAERHLIKPWPTGLAKSETDWWPVKLREWMSGRAKEEAGRGYYYRASNLDTARALVKDRVLPVEPTEDVLDGYVVFAHPARDYHYHSWEKDPSAGPALVYFETDDPPLAFDDRVYWPHDVHMTEARIAGIRPSNTQLAKAEGSFRSAGFRHRTEGHVVETGPYHSIDPWLLGGSANHFPTSPADSSDWEAGFITHDGKFLNREEAGRHVGLQRINPITNKPDIRLDSAHVESGLGTEGFKKSEPLSRGPAFNGEKDYRPDESGDPKFPFLGGAKKEQSHEQLPDLPGNGLEPGEHATALAQLGHSEAREAALAAACFLARRRFDWDKFQQAMAVFNDERRAALHAVDLADSEKNIQALEAVMKLQGPKAHALAKSEPQPIGIHSVQPGNEDAVDAAEAIERAVRGGFVQHLKLNGKHSKGAMAARDPRSGRVWLLKPGSGKQSPASGARDGTASQSRREAAFWHVADQLHLGGVIPRADLLIVNAQEWAAIKLLGADWKSLDERNREKQYKGREVLEPYRGSGQLHRWGILDYVLGNTDSHGQNLLVNNGGSVALIDHGAAFAGPKFDPAHDTKSFIPFYLRVWAPDTDFKKLTPEERVKHMPTLGHNEDEVLKRWLVEDFTPELVERVARKYGIDDGVIKACLARLQELRSAPGNLSRTVNALWAGARRPQPDETR